MAAKITSAASLLPTSWIRHCYILFIDKKNNSLVCDAKLDLAGEYSQDENFSWWT